MLLKKKGFVVLAKSFMGCFGYFGRISRTILNKFGQYNLIFTISFANQCDMMRDPRHIIAGCGIRPRFMIAYFAADTIRGNNPALNAKVCMCNVSP